MYLNLWDPWVDLERVEVGDDLEWMKCQKWKQLMNIFNGIVNDEEGGEESSIHLFPTVEDTVWKRWRNIERTNEGAERRAKNKNNE